MVLTPPYLCIFFLPSNAIQEYFAPLQSDEKMSDCIILSPTSHLALLVALFLRGSEPPRSSPMYLACNTFAASDPGQPSYSGAEQI